MSELVLVVDDDPAIREVVGFALRKAGFRTEEAADGREALVQFGRLAPSLLVLDINMPELSGTDVCRTIRGTSSVPIVFLSSNDDEIDRVLGLELGGDDYVTKPFSPRELVARVRAVLRRAAGASGSGGAGSDAGLATAAEVDDAGVLEHGPLRVDSDRFLATFAGTPVTLTVTEFGLLRTLLRRPSKVFTRDELMAGAYSDYTVVSDRTIDSHVRRVRRKFAAVGCEVIETVHGLGYRLGPG